MQNSQLRRSQKGWRLVGLGVCRAVYDDSRLQKVVFKSGTEVNKDVKQKINSNFFLGGWEELNESYFFL